MPNAVEQKRKTTVAAPTTAGSRAGSVTVRKTCNGLAPSAAAACSRRGSRLSQNDPTVRTTTETLKKTSAATIAAAVPSRCSPPSQPDGTTSWLNATPTTTVGSTNGTTTSARSRPRPGNDSRCRTKARGSPASSVTSVARPADHSVNQSTRPVRGRPSTSSTAPGANWPSLTKPSPTMPSTG